MTNSEISDKLKFFADLSELHGGNPFKVKSYSIASFRIDKLQDPLMGKTVAELEKIEGIGKSVSGKIYELCTTETIDELEKLIAITPTGVLELFKVKGIGPKKIGYIWKELGIESIGELLYACKENRLAQAKGFGAKTQDSIKKNIEFIFANANLFHYSNIERTSLQLIDVLAKIEGIQIVSTTGALRRKCEILDKIELIIGSLNIGTTQEKLSQLSFIHDYQFNDNKVSGKINGMIPIIISIVPNNEFAYHQFSLTASENHLKQIVLNDINIQSEEAIYKANQMQYIEPELREGLWEIERAKSNSIPKLIELTDLKGILHNHSTWSDGSNTLEEMAVYCKYLGYEYLGICDHSKSAFYANGLNEERIIKQH